jgi:hypothetical protein
MTCRLRGIGDADPQYLARLEEAILRAADAAGRDKRAVRIAWASAPAAIGTNRRQVVPTAEGPRAVLGRTPAGPADAAVRALHLQGTDRSIVLFHHACHPYCLGGDSTLISADFWGYAAKALAERGHQSIYLNGCAGDLAPELGFGGVAAAQETGARLADAVLRALAPARPAASDELQMHSSRFTLEHDRLPDLAQIEADLSKADNTVRDAERDDPLVRQRIRAAWREWFGELKSVLDREGKLPPLPARISIMRLGDGAVIALPGEVFHGIGSRIAASLPADPALVAAYCHGYIGYVPAPEAFPLGGYEVEEAHRYAGLWRIAPQAASVLAAQVADLWRSPGA